jgi:hydrogenase maturation protease
MAKVLVLGLGNLLLSDEGIGVRVIERLQEMYEFPEEVQVLDGGTKGLELLPYVDDATLLLVVDAVKARRPPGALIRLTTDEIPSFLDATKISPHQEGLQDILALARLRGTLPKEVVLWGVQVGSMEPGLEFTPPVAAQVAPLVEKVLEELKQWGVAPNRKRTEP